MNLNSIRKVLFTNIVAEQLLLLCIKSNLFRGFFSKLLPGNILYPKGTMRKANRNGINYYLDISDYQAWLIYFMSDRDSSVNILNYLKDATTILDIGANMGHTALEINKDRLSRIKNFSITCFEPYPENFSMLQHNLTLNSTAHIQVENLGLGAEERLMKMYKDCDTNSGGNRIVYEPTKNTLDVEEVRVTSLDNYLNSKNINKVDFIKIDVEGYEYEVLKGGIETLKTMKPRLFIELDNENLKNQGSSAHELISFLEQLGYSVSDAENKHDKNQLKTLNIHTDIYCE